MKLYFHFQLGITYDYSTVSAIFESEISDEKSDIKTCLKQVCKQLSDHLKIDVSLSAIEILSDRKKVIAIDTKIDSLSNGADLIIKVSDDANKSKIKYEKTLITKEIINSKQPKDDKAVEQDEETKSLLSNAARCLSKKRHDLALVAYRDVLNVKPTNFDALFGVAYIYFKAKRFTECLPYFEKVVSKNSSNHEVLLDYSHALLQCDDSSKAVSILSRCINDLKRSNQDANSVHDANVGLAEALESMGQLPHAFQLFLNVSQVTEKQHVDGLLGYARVGYKLGHVTLDDVFIVVLNAIAQKKNDKKVQTFFTKMVQQRGGFEALQNQMHVAWNDAPAVVYIATFLREHGALNECMRLLKHAFTLAPNSIDISLLMVHVHENLCTFDDELKFAAEFLDGKLDRQVVRKVDLSPIVKLIRHIMKGNNDGFDEIVNKELSTEKEERTLTGSMATLELQLLALYFTVVKTCFVIGHLKAVEVFVKLLDPLFRMNNDLHKTLIRNEQAYYSCISQIYSMCPPSVPKSESNEQFYFVGDSHVLPVAWRSMECKGTEYVIHPVLITGLKIWHLRKESSFYTKVNFENSMKHVPNGSTCIFALGEIDCREGIVLAVEKCIYDNLNECISTVVDIYVKYLLDLQRSKKLKIFVHPVPPVLEETATNVRLFNEHLKKRVLKTSKLFWLDFLEELIDGDLLLKDEYKFDGVHLHPNYVRVLEKSLQKHY